MAKFYPQDIIEDLLSSADIVEVVSSRLGALKKAGNNHLAICPFHQEKTPSFNISQSKNFYHCFGCGVSGNSLNFIMEFDRVDFVEAINILARETGYSLPKENTQAINPHQIDKKNKILSILYEAAKVFYKNLRNIESMTPEDLKGIQQAQVYLKNRTVSSAIAKEYILGYALNSWNNILNTFSDPILLEEAGLIKNQVNPNTNESGSYYDRFRDRVIFPIRDPTGNVVGFGGRDISGKNPAKYLNSPETAVFHKSEILYGLYEYLKYLKNNKVPTNSFMRESLIFVEGYMDVISLVQADVRNVVATLGTAINAKHLKLAYKHVKRIIICFDGDHAGVQAAFKAMMVIVNDKDTNLNISFAFMPEGIDPDDFIKQRGSDDFLYNLEGAKSLTEVIMDYLFLDVEKLDELNKVKEVLKKSKTLLKSSNSLLKEVLIKELAMRLGIPAIRIARELEFFLKDLKTPPPNSTKQIKALDSNEQIIRNILFLFLETNEVYDRGNLFRNESALHPLNDKNVLVQFRDKTLGFMDKVIKSFSPLELKSTKSFILLVDMLPKLRQLNDDSDFNGFLDFFKDKPDFIEHFTAIHQSSFLPSNYLADIKRSIDSWYYQKCESYLEIYKKDLTNAQLMELKNMITHN